LVGEELDLPDEVYGFGSWLLWLLATRATDVVDRAYAAGPARPSRHYGTVDGHPVPTPSLVAWLLTAAEYGVPLDQLPQRDRKANERQKVLRTIVSRAVGGEPHLFKDAWLWELAPVCGLGDAELDLLARSRDEEGYPVDPQALRAAIARTLGSGPGATASALRQSSLLPLQRSEVARQPVSLAPRPLFLVGREELLAELDARLSLREDLGPQIAALSGLAGAGKTSVAVEYAHRHLSDVGAAWQLPADEPTVLAAEFTRLRGQLESHGGPDTQQDPVQSVHAMLAAYPGKWLLIFDNAPDWTSVQAFLPPAGPGQVLITSQSALWPPGLAVDVPVLDAKVSAEFLLGRTGERDRHAALQLAEEMGGLPLALEQAAAYLQATGDGLTSYLTMFRRRRADLLARGQPIGYSKTVATTWALAFTRLDRAGAGAVELLRLLALCAPEAIPLRLLLQPRPVLDLQFGAEVTPALTRLIGDPLAANDALVELRRHSLINPAGDGMVSVHRLVQAVTVDQMPAPTAGAWRHAAATLIEAAIPEETDRPENWPVFSALLPHAQAVLTPGSLGMERIASYLGERTSYLAARDLCRQILDAREQISGPEHPSTLSARYELARWTGNAGDMAGARDQFAALLPIQERVLGPEHPSTLNTRHKLAEWTGNAGDPAGARDQFAALLPIQERILGSEHPSTLSTRHELAYWTGDAGNAVAARDQFAALLPVWERVLGPEHRFTLSTRHELAQCTGDAGDPAGARDQFAALVTIRERIFGPDHRETLANRSNLANCTGAAGDAAGARDLFAALLPVLQRVFGPEHPDTLVVRNNLAYYIGAAGDPAAARDEYAALLPIRGRAMGPEHPHVLTTRAHLARWTGEAGDAAGARDQLAALLTMRERVSGPEHPRTLATRHLLARWTGEAGDAADARDQLAALLPVRERALGGEHPDTLSTRHELARWTGQAGDAAGARDQLAALLPVRERVLGPQHPDTRDTKDQLRRWTKRRPVVRSRP
jgi:Tetratricopeptide repeat